MTRATPGRNLRSHDVESVKKTFQCRRGKAKLDVSRRKNLGASSRVKDGRYFSMVESDHAVLLSRRSSDGRTSSGGRKTTRRGRATIFQTAIPFQQATAQKQSITRGRGDH